MDLIDREPGYIRSRDMRGWEAHVRTVFERELLQRWIPATGDVVELGTARAINFNYLCELFGPHRCRGYDLVNDAQHPRVTVSDVRELGPEHDGPIALGWNDLSDWEQSPASKRAGRSFILRSLIRGGLYVDAGLREGEPPPQLRDCTLEAAAGGVLIWRRERGGPTPPASRRHGTLSPPPAWWQWLDRVLRIDPRPVWTPPSEALCWELGATGRSPTPEACAEAFMRGASELLGRLRVREQGRWSDGILASGRLAVMMFVGDEPLTLVAAGPHETRTLQIARGSVLIIPPRWSLHRQPRDRPWTRPYYLRVEHHAPVWVSLPLMTDASKKSSA